MKRYLLLLFLSVATLASAQQTPNAAKQAEKRKEQIAEKKAEYIKSIIEQLDIDEFQGHIVTQKLNDYFEEKLKILQTNKPYFQREQELQDLDATYFEDLNDIIPKEKIEKMKGLISGEVKEESKKKKKRKKKNKD